MEQIKITSQDVINIRFADEVIEKASKKNEKKIKGLVKWVGEHGFNECVAKVSQKHGIDSAKAVCGSMKQRARKSGQLAKKHMGRLEKKRSKKK